MKLFWGSREAARLKQIKSGTTDQGERAGVTAGKNMDGFLALVLDLIRANGLAHAEIHQNRAMLTLPGYFRPTKLWDLLVLYITGKNMDGFLALVLDLIRANGLAHAEIHQNRAMLTLPGYFRPTKLWDLLVLYIRGAHRGHRAEKPGRPVLR